jgi:hypothetical protein
MGIGHVKTKTTMCFSCKKDKRIKYTMSFDVLDHDTGQRDTRRLEYCESCFENQIQLQQLGKELANLS